MNIDTLSQTQRSGNLNLQIFADKTSLGFAAATQAAEIIGDAIRKRGSARVIIATGNSQDEVIAALVVDRTVDWKHVTVFHMDEYVGISATHPASFRAWLQKRVVNLVHPGACHYLDGDATDLATESNRYASLLREAPIDLAFVGFGENGHIAFNDPHAADFKDPLTVKIVELDEECRKQQVGEGHFPTFEAVPQHAVTLTCPALMASLQLVCCVPDSRKAKAVRDALEGPIWTTCPASIVRTHPSAWLYLDQSSASRLSPATRAGIQ
jgi:glucosamine-6-phosphate deaminase